MDTRTKKKLIIAAIVAVVIIGVILYLHFAPVWTSVVNVVVVAVGIVVGWIAHVLYNKYIKE
jgi:hypothetical protein